MLTTCVGHGGVSDCPNSGSEGEETVVKRGRSTGDAALRNRQGCTDCAQAPTLLSVGALHQLVPVFFRRIIVLQSASNGCLNVELRGGRDSGHPGQTNLCFPFDMGPMRRVEWESAGEG